MTHLKLFWEESSTPQKLKPEWPEESVGKGGQAVGESRSRDG